MANCNHKYIIYATWICRGSLTASTWSHQIRIWRVWSWLCFENRSVRSIRVRNRTRFLFLLLFLFLFLYFWLGSARGCKWHLIFEQDRGCINWKRVETIRCARQTQKLTRPYGILLSSVAAAPPTRSLTLTFQPKVRPQSELGWAGWAADCQFHGQVNNFLSRQLQECQLWSSSSSRNRNQPVMPANWYSNCSPTRCCCCCSSSSGSDHGLSSHCSFWLAKMSNRLLGRVRFGSCCCFLGWQAQNGNKKRNQHHELRIKLQIFAARCSFCCCCCCCCSSLSKRSTKGETKANRSWKSLGGSQLLQLESAGVSIEQQFVTHKWSC